MIQHQADSSEQPQDSPISATTRRGCQRSSLEIIAEALNTTTGKERKKTSFTATHLDPLSSSSVGEMHQRQRSNDDREDDR